MNYIFSYYIFHNQLCLFVPTALYANLDVHVVVYVFQLKLILFKQSIRYAIIGGGGKCNAKIIITEHVSTWFI